MYTQCEHCKAIFRINMREVTVAKGKLRCGECKKVFNATNNLSTTLPEPYKAGIQVEEIKSKEAPVKSRKKTEQLSSSETTKKKEKTNWPLVLVLSLALLLLGQILYNNRHLFLNIPRHEPSLIKMISHNVFVHPNETGVLLISATMMNTATFEQAYPILEIKLTDAASKVISLRRFTPREYLENYRSGLVLPVNRAINIKLKIKDPGNKAKRFQFGFL